MRLMVDLSARADATYQNNYHNKLRGRLWRSLQGTRFEEEHGDGRPMGLSFSNVFPWGELSEGDERTLLVASPREELLAAIAENLQADREFNVGEMPFEVDGLTPVDVDVGEPGTRGVVETSTGVVVRLYERHRDEYGIDGDHGDTPTYWRPEYTIEPFRDAITENLQRKHERFAPEYVPGPDDVESDLFDGYEFLKTYALPTTVTEGVELELVVSKWRFDYRVRDDTHRRHLNLALDTGIGGRNGLGFGFVNVVDRTRPGETELEGEDAFA
ncbi:CRISPR-associated endoribonuclease Cas6 [Salinirarus marinus]|uniref:CRISPR-associated endoribonuclease Cas6 n=1 Tax=Salinirarus marinus TaxID=3068310 RepID=UPI003C6C485E